MIEISRFSPHIVVVFIINNRFASNLFIHVPTVVPSCLISILLLLLPTSNLLVMMYEGMLCSVVMSCIRTCDLSAPAYLTFCCCRSLVSKTTTRVRVPELPYPSSSSSSEDVESANATMILLACKASPRLFTLLMIDGSCFNQSTGMDHSKTHAGEED